MRLQIKLIAVLILTVGVVISISTYNDLNKTLESANEELDSRGHSLSETLSTFVIEDLIAWDYPALQTAIHHTGESDERIMAIEIYQYGKVVANYSRGQYEEENYREYTAPVIFHIEATGEERELGTVKVVLSEERYQAALTDKINSALIMGLALLIVITVLIYSMMNWLILKPLRQIEYGTKIVSKGDLEHRIVVESDDEIGRLAKAFNMMTYSLKLSRDETDDYKRNLEEKVEERTGELRKAYDKLKELDVMKSQFFATVSHELRTPLTLILSPLESMKQGDVGSFSADQKKFIETMHKNTLVLLKLINNLLDFSKIEAGKMKVNYEKQDIVELVKVMMESALHTAERRNINLTMDADRDVPEIYFDREKIEKVFYNLLSNALKFTPDKGQIKIEVRNKGNVVAVSVSDTGIGIPEKDQKRIFDRFAQVDSSAARQYGGTGIGLSLAKELTELHQGKIYLDSSPGRGSTFTFELPSGTSHIDKDLLVEEKAGETEKRMRAEALSKEISDRVALEFVDIQVDEVKPFVPESKDKDKPTVLVIEDNPDLVGFLVHLLSDQYNVLTAGDGVEGIEKVNAEIPDLVISDIMMPRKDGYAVCKEIKSGERTKHIPVILLTAKADISMKIEGLEYGADDYVTKPFNSKELMARIKSLLNLREMEGEIQERSMELEKLNLQLEVALDDLKETQSQLLQSEKMATMGTLAGGVAHEINNPLGAILANAQMLLRDVKNKEDRESLELIEESARRCRDIVKSLLTYSRKPATEKFKPVDLNEVIGDTCNLLKHQLEGENIKIETEYGKLPRFPGNANELQQVFTNLILNSRDAIKELDKPGKIIVKTSHEGDFIVSRVIDDGAGIEQKNIEKVFDPFFTTKNLADELGTGLGLSITRKIVEKHSGEISIESEVGEGTTITVRFRLSDRKFEVSEGDK